MEEAKAETRHQGTDRTGRKPARQRKDWPNWSPGEGDREAVALASCHKPGPLSTLGESLVTVTRKRYMDAVMPAIMNSSRPWRGFP